MKILVQRVKNACVKVDGETTGEIQKGFLLYVCFEDGDTEESLKKSIDKIKKLRIFEDEAQKMNLNIQQVQGEILSISQFTLSWDGSKGHRPSFDKSMHPAQARLMYKNFNDALKGLGIKVEEGRFGADMKVSSSNDGPVTFFLDF